MAKCTTKGISRQSPRSTTATGAHFDLDAICAELGAFGPYQRRVYFCICIAIAIYGQNTLTYVFTSGDLIYRCFIPGQDTIRPNASVSTAVDVISEFSPPWLSDYVPFELGRSDYPKKCKRYASRAKNDATTDSHQLEIDCGVADGFVYETEERIILNEFSLQCSENDWKRTIVGSVNNAALFVGLPLMGILSDRFGRKKIFIWGFFGCGIAGILKSFSTSYPMFLMLEFLDALIGSGTFMGGFVLGMELVGPGQRSIGSALMMCFYAIGGIMLGTYASWTTSFRTLLRLCYTPAMFVLGFFWCVPESFRWLMISGRKREAAEIIMQAAKVNRVTLREDTIQRLQDHCNAIETSKSLDSQPQSTFRKNESLFASRVLVFRTLACCFCWLVNAFVGYGLTLNSVSFSGSKYTNFNLMVAVEIPAYIATCFITTHVGRRWSLCGMMLLAGCSCLGTLFLPNGAAQLSTSSAFRLPFFLAGKFAITSSFSILYIYTTEIFPTGMRNSMMSTCSMIARLGSMLAPQTPLLERFIPSLPLMLYSGSAIFSGLMVLQFPETFDTKLPDTIEQAISIGKRPSPRQDASVRTSLV